MDHTLTTCTLALNLKTSSFMIARKLIVNVRRITGVASIRVTRRAADMKDLLQRTRCISERISTSESICLNIRLDACIRRPSTSTVRMLMEY